MPESTVPAVPVLPTIRTRSRPPRKPSKALVKSKPVQPKSPDPNAPWVVFWASEDPKLKRVLIGCERCGCRMSFPNKTPVHKIESAMIGFRLDHQACEEKPAAVTPIRDSVR